MVPASFSFWGLLAFLGLWPYSSNFCLLVTLPSPLLSASIPPLPLSYKSTLMIAPRAHLIIQNSNPFLKILDHICKNLFFFFFLYKVKFTGSRHQDVNIFMVQFSPHHREFNPAVLILITILLFLLSSIIVSIYSTFLNVLSSYFPFAIPACLWWIINLQSADVMFTSPVYILRVVALGPFTTRVSN